jgi:hypothetical protein
MILPPASPVQCMGSQEYDEYSTCFAVYSCEKEGDKRERKIDRKQIAMLCITIVGSLGIIKI